MSPTLDVHPPVASPGHRAPHSTWAGLALVLAGLVQSGPTQALPSFARQTGMPCVACHTGGFGPQLTDFGIQFKLGGYTMAKPDAPAVPLSGMVIVSATRTAADQADPLPDHVRANNNLKLDQASLFLAGRLGEYLGVFSQLTHDGIAHKTALDETELRYARALTLGGHATTLGLVVNNDPGNSEPFNALPTWGFPFIASSVAPVPETSTLLEGALTQFVVGTTAYAMVDSRWYAALGTYQTLGSATQQRLGLDPAGSPGILHGASYARLDAKQSFGDHWLAGGLVWLDTGLQPDRLAPDRNHVRDLGVDASYRWQLDNDHVLSLMGSAIYERQQHAADVASGRASQVRGSLHSLNLAATYYLNQTWGINLQRFALTGNRDELLYGGFTANKPGSSGTRLQLDWTPYGKSVPGGWPDPNLRIGLQYTAYDKFNGAELNYDGSGRNARDNNTTYLFACLMF